MASASVYCGAGRRTRGCGNGVTRGGGACQYRFPHQIGYRFSATNLAETKTASECPASSGLAIGHPGERYGRADEAKNLITKICHYFLLLVNFLKFESVEVLLT
jgi:hypothetical protein